MVSEMKKKVMLLAAAGFISLNVFAQQSEKAALNNTMPVSATDTVHAAVAKKDLAVTKTFEKKASFSLSAGTMVSNYGMASYLAPALRYQLSPKFSVFGGVTYLNSNYTAMHAENKTPMASKNYFVHAGGSYQVTDKLRLSGSVWRDFSAASNTVLPGSLSRPGRYGTEFQAHYKITEHLSLFGSFRTVNGNGLNPYYGTPAGLFSPATQGGF